MITIRRVAFGVLWIGMIVLPLYIVLNPLPSGYWQENTFTATLNTIIRLFGLVLFTLITQQILTQEYRPTFNRVMGAYFTKRYHIILGTFTLLVALLHPLSYYISMYLEGSSLISTAFGQGYDMPLRIFYLFGPLALTLMICTVLAGLLRNWKPLQRYWYSIHKLNYILFIVAFFHSWNMGSDIQSNTILRVLWILYLLVIVYGFINKFYLRRLRARAPSPTPAGTTAVTSN